MFHHCGTGEVTRGHGDIPTNNVVTHFIDMTNSNENRMCQDCPPNMACLSYGADVYLYSGDNS